MKEYRKQQLKYLIMDAISAEVVWISFLIFRWLVYEGKVFSIQTILIPAFDFYKPLIIFPITCLVIYYLSGYYIRPFYKRFGKEFLTTAISSIIIALGAFFVIIIDDQVDDYRNYIISLAVFAAIHFIITYIPRLCITLYIRKKNIQPEEIIIRPEDDWDEEQIYKQISAVYPTGKDILLVPRLLDIVTGAAHINEIGGSPYIRITDTHMTDAGLCIKRASDIVLSAIGGILLSPILLLIAVAIKWSSKGPILYKQERIGHYGKAFMIIKFRTMHVGSESDVPQLSQDNDPRVTKIGHWLRKYRLDELPQLWNVIKGDMSLVGPRPERAYFIQQIEEKAPYYCLLYKIRPGLTSWGPIKVGYTDTIEKMVERLNYDIAYMENQSIGLDIKILFHTIKVIFNGEGK